jgi:hypothetical protein
LTPIFYSEYSQIADNSQIFLDTLIQEADSQIPNIKDYYMENYNNWMALNGHFSKWRIRDILEKELITIITKEQTYLEKSSLGTVNFFDSHGYNRRIFKGQAASLDKVCVNLGHVRSTMGKFKDYCPVRYLDHKELCLEETEKTTFTAVYKVIYSRLDFVNIH